MNYLVDTASILIFMGYNPMSDFTVQSTDGVITLIWRHSDPTPMAEDIAQQELPWRRWQRKTGARQSIETYIDGAIQPVTRSMLRDGEPVIDNATAEAVRNFIADCYGAVNAFDDLVDLADLEAINTVAVDLPAYVGPAQ